VIYIFVRKLITAVMINYLYVNAILLCVLIICVILYIYYYMGEQKDNKSADAKTKTETLEARDQTVNKYPLARMYFTTWCGFCKAAKPIWEDMATNIPNIIFQSVNCDKIPMKVESTTLFTPSATKNVDPSLNSAINNIDFVVEGYPTIIVIDRYGKVHKFSGPVTNDSLYNWIIRFS